MADGWGDVVVDHPPIPMGGRRSEVLDAFGHPDLAHEAGDRRCRAGADTDLVGPVGEVRSDCFGVLAGVAGQMPAPPFPARGGVDAVVGDDVEAVLFGDDVGHCHSVPAGRFGRRLRSQPGDQCAPHRSREAVIIGRIDLTSTRATSAGGAARGRALRPGITALGVDERSTDRKMDFVHRLHNPSGSSLP